MRSLESLEILNDPSLRIHSLDFRFRAVGAVYNQIGVRIRDRVLVSTVLGIANCRFSIQSTRRLGVHRS